MPSATNNAVDMMMALNSFGKEFDPQSIPSYSEWLANNSFDPFGPEPFGSTSSSHAGIPLRSKLRDGFHDNKGMGVVDRPDQGYGLSKDTTRVFPQERSRFAFAQTRIGRTVDQRRIPVLTKITTTVPRVVGSRPFRFLRGLFAGKKPTLAAPKAVRPLPTWLTHFEDYEDELLAEFCPLEDPTSSLPPTPAMVGPKLPQLNVTLLSGSVGSGSSCAFEEVGGGYSDEDEEIGEETEGYYSIELDTPDSDSVQSLPESSALANHWVGTMGFHWPTPYQGPQVADGKGHSLADVVRPLEYPPKSSLSHRHRQILASPPVDEPIAAPPNRPTAASFTARDDVPKVATDWCFAEAEEESECGPESLLRLVEEGWYGRFDLTGCISLAPPQWSWSLRAVTKLEAPPPVYPATIPLPDTEEREDIELDAIVISPRSPIFG